MAKVKKKELVKHSKKLNKLELTEDPIEVDGDVDEIKESFIEAIEEIDDDNAIDEVPDKILDFYEALIEDPDSDDDDDDDEDEKPKKKKKKGKKSKGKKKKVVEEDEDDDDDDDEDEKPKKKKGKKGKKAGKKGKKAKKGKKKKKSKSDLPKGLRTGTLPAAVYEAIKEGDATWADLAAVVAEEKDKEPESCLGLAMRTVSRKVSKAVEIQVVFNGEDDTAVFNLVGADEVPDEDEDEDD